MRSGLGPAEHLKEVGITVVKDLPAVGSNLVSCCSLRRRENQAINPDMVCGE